MNTVGAIHQLIRGEGPFKYLYEIRETDTGRDLVLRDVVCGDDTSQLYIAGKHFTAEHLSMVHGSILAGRTIWDNGDEAIENSKKAIALMRKLKGHLVNFDSKSYAVQGYISGHNIRQFYQYILDGMYYEMTREKEATGATSSRPGTGRSPVPACEQRGSR